MKKMYVTLLGLAFSVVSMQAQKIEWSSHRGLSRDYVENTVLSLQKAYEAGTDAAEIDIRLSKDRKVMVMHDGNTRRLTDGAAELEVTKTDSEVLRSLNIGAKKGTTAQMAYLHEIIEIVPAGKKLYIELKHNEEILPLLKAEIEKAPKKVQKGLCIIGSDIPVLAMAKRMMPKQEVHLLIDEDEDYIGRIELSAAAGLDGIDSYWKIVTKELVDKVHNLKMGFYVWTVDDPEEAKRLIKCGVDGIESNSVPRLKELMGIK